MDGRGTEVAFRISTVAKAIVTEVLYDFSQSTQEIPGYNLELG